MKILIAVLAVFGLLGMVAAPVEWLWPAKWGGNTHWDAGEGYNEKKISLTFDDGPSAYTAQVLDQLKVHDAKATFFVMGQEVIRYPEVVARMAAEGHELGNHTYDFAAQSNKLFSWIDLDSIEKNQDVIEQFSGQRPIFYRSPGAQMGRFLYREIRLQNLEVVYGALPLPHPKKSAEEQLKIALSTIEPGAIIILHDGDDQEPDSERPQATVDLLPELLEEIYKQGYEVVTVSELLGRTQQPSEQ